ncbi:MAG: peptidylprolyl isomerase [Bacteroidota bacterium]
MKQLFITLLVIIPLLVCGQKNDDAVVMEVNGEPITKKEFLQVYLKNNDNPKFDKASLDEYMDLFKKFKFKVAEAEELGYDTIPSIQKELKGYKQQLARPYLVDSSKNEELVKEAYERMKEEVRASHILVKVPPSAPPEDTLEAYNRIVEMKKRIENGASFESVATSKNGSEDPSAKENKGDLGFFTAFQMVYPFETAAYTTEVGEISNPIRTKYGYHIVKVTDKREARGTITTAHIMVALQKNAGKSDIQSAQQKIDEIHQKLEEGEPFENLVKLYSDDRGSKSKGGRLPAFGSGTNQRMVPEFEEAAFALENDGDYTDPVQTDYGFHIIKRLDYDPLKPFDSLKSELQSKVNRGSRGQKTQKSFIQNLKRENKFKDKKEKRIDWFYENVDSTVFKGKWEAPQLSKNKWMFKYKGRKYMMQEFADFLGGLKRKNPINMQAFINRQYTEWQNEQIIADEKSRLKEKYPEYRAMLQEYHDGILLYEIMKDKVWDRAIKDTTGLEAYFEKHQKQYQWPQRYQATIFSAKNQAMLDTAIALYKLDTMDLRDILTTVNKESQLNLSGEEGKFIPERHPLLKDRSLDQGVNEPFKKEEKHHLIIVEEVLKPSDKSLQEARGQVVQDYQNHLEKTWIEELKKKHTIDVNEAVLYSLGE